MPRLVVGHNIHTNSHWMRHRVGPSVVLAWAGESLNDLGRTHWRSFATINYFDLNGLFMASVFGLPIVLNTLLSLVRAERARGAAG